MRGGSHASSGSRDFASGAPRNPGTGKTPADRPNLDRLDGSNGSRSDTNTDNSGTGFKQRKRNSMREGNERGIRGNTIPPLSSEPRSGDDAPRLTPRSGDAKDVVPGTDGDP